MPLTVKSKPSASSEPDWPESPSKAACAWADLTEGLAKNWLWMTLAMQDIKLRYRGSVLGPFWLTISTAVMVLAMGTLYAKLFHVDIAQYLPFVAVGLVIWQLISTTINEGCNTFLVVQPVIQQVRLPFSVHAYRLVYRNYIILAHNFIIIPMVLLFFWIPVHWTVLQIVPALVVLFVNGIWLGILFGMLSARFRDIPPIVASFLQVVFFVTPIFWSPDLLGVWKRTAELNPLFAAIDVVRAPLLGLPVAPYSWPVLLLVTGIGCAATFALFARFRSRIAFWV